MNLDELCPAERTHLEILERWREAMNLVGPGPLDVHFLDAIHAVQGLDASGRWADLGSGAGFPGIALAARCPDASVLLVESRQKRAVFLEQVVAEAGLRNARVVCRRVEDLDQRFDGIISRAYRPPEAFLGDAGRLLDTGGRVVVLTGPDAVMPSGWQVHEERRYQVLGRGRVRWVVCPSQPGTD